MGPGEFVYELGRGLFSLPFGVLLAIGFVVFIIFKRPPGPPPPPNSK